MQAAVLHRDNDMSNRVVGHKMIAFKDPGSYTSSQIANL